MTITETIITFAGQYPVLIGVLIFLAAFLESIPLLGSLFPGSAAVLLLSGAVGAAGGPIWPLIAWGIGGGFAGDVLAYWIGRRYGLTLREVWPFTTRPALWEYASRFLHRHGGKSVILSRFIPGARAVTPVAAGALGMKAPFFVITSIVAALAWAMVYVVPAAILGQLLSTAGHISARLFGAALTIIIALALVIWLARFAAGVAGPRIYRFYRQWISRMERSSNPYARQIGGLLDPALATIGPHLLWGTVLLVSAIGLFGIVEGFIASTELVDIDGSIRSFARSLRSAPIDSIMLTVTAFGEGWVIAISAALVVAVLLIGRAQLTAAIVASVFVATFVFVPTMNSLLGQSFPVGDVHPALSATGFPSSHATLVTLFCGIVAALATPTLGAFGRTIAWSLAVAVATLVGISRIYLDALWPSDVAGGLLLGLALTAIFAMIRTGFEAEIGKSLRYPILACIVFVAVGGVRAATYEDADLAIYAPRAEIVTFDEKQWLADAWRKIPIRRADLLGDFEEAISFQVAADPAALEAALAKSGWKPVPPFQLRDLFLFLSPTTPLGMLPPLPLMESGRLPSQTFTRAGASPRQRQVIRLWPTDFAIHSNQLVHPLFVGSISGEQVMRPFEALTVLDTLPPGEDIQAFLNSIIRHATPQLSVFERRGAAGPVLLVAPHRGAMTLSSNSVRP